MNEKLIYIVLRRSEDSQTFKAQVMATFENYTDAMNNLHELLREETRFLEESMNVTDWHVYPRGYDWSDNGYETVKVRFEIHRSYLK